MDRHKIALIIPAHNEELTIGHVIKGAFLYGTPIVINDYSSDNTSEIANKFGAIVINSAVNLGYDGAINMGFEYAYSNNFEYVITLDADGQHQINNIPIFLNHLDSDTDLVIGIRDLIPRFSETLFKFISYKIWSIEDPLCGFKAYKLNSFKAFGVFDSYNSIGTELCLYAASSNMKITQLHIRINKRQDNPRFGSALRSNLKIIRSLFWGIYYYYLMPFYKK